MSNYVHSSGKIPGQTQTTICYSEQNVYAFVVNIHCYIPLTFKVAGEDVAVPALFFASQKYCPL